MTGVKSRNWTVLFLASCMATPMLASEGPPQTAKITIDDDGPRNPWGSTIGDINGDGRPDLVVGGHARRLPGLLGRVLNKLGIGEEQPAAGELVWYQNPNWQKNVITTEFNNRTDLAVGDVDGDGVNDIVVIADQGVFWLKNPSWRAKEIPTSKAPPKFHDIELSDLDQDGDVDIVLRNQSLFGHESGDSVYILTQELNQEWRETILKVGHGEGLKVADLNADGYDDIVINDIWLINPLGDVAESTWIAVDYTDSWDWPDVYIDTFDLNADGAVDILVSPAEPTGGKYRISWFEAPGSIDDRWTEHVIEDDIETVHHFIGTGDFDGDGFADIFSAKMNQGNDPDDVKVYLNTGDHDSWKKLVLDRSGSHSMQVADLDSDQDVEVIGVNWEIEDYRGLYPVSMWDYVRNPPRGWQRHVIGDNGPWRNLFIYAADLDGDRQIDIIAGRSWFKNPGTIGGNWRRYEFDHGLTTALYLDDFDNDGRIDVLGSSWDGLLEEPGILLRAKAKLFGNGYPGSGNGGAFKWARNTGSGEFRIYDNIERVNGDYLQGIAAYALKETKTLLLSWHRKNNGIQRITIPGRPLDETWHITSVTEASQDEQLSVRDVNGDQVEDVVTGTNWLDPAKRWKVNNFHPTPDLPDRHAIVDIDSDGALDVVVGYEAVSRTGKLAWYSAVSLDLPPGQREHIIDFPIGPMSLGVADMDNDDDIDVIVGEHDLERPQGARLLLYSNLDGKAGNWRKSIIATGDEHHNGALPIDLDQDGDKDIVSIGWGHSNVLVYENLRIR